MRAVNLLPRDVGRRSIREQANFPAVVGGLGAVLVTAILAILFMTANGKVRQNRDDLETARSELAATPAPPLTPPGQSQIAGEEQQRVTALSTALGQRVAWDRVLRQLSLVLPDDVWLSGLSAKSPTAAAAPGSTDTSGAPTGLTLDGYTYSQEGVARLLSRMGVVPDLANVQLQKSSSSTLGGHRVVQFTIVSDIRGPGAAS